MAARYFVSVGGRSIFDLFIPNSRYKVAGQGSNSDNGMLWEVSGDYINYYDSTGDYGYLMIDEEDGKPILVMFDSQHYPCLTLREVKGTPQKSKSGRTVRKK